MAKPRIYQLFLSHAWTYSTDYYRLAEYINARLRSRWHNHAVPRHEASVDPRSEAGREALVHQLEAQIRPTDCVLILAGMYPRHRAWLLVEMDIARRHGIPILGVVPWAPIDVPEAVANAVSEMLPWDPDVIAAAIRRHAPPAA